MAFEDIAGNTTIKRVLRLALERGRAPHSLIFAGPEGVGKMATALTLAKALNCKALTADSCDECPSCRAVDNDSHPDVMALTVEAQKQKVSVEQTDLLKRMAYLRPMMGKRRVFIVDDAKDMSVAAANSLLKVLEEPPPFTHVVLLTDGPHLLLPTIRSRCRLLTFSPIGREEIEENLLRLDFGRDQARILALLVDGNLDRARELDWEEVQTLREEAWSLFEDLASADRSSRFLERFGTVPKSVLETFVRVLEVFATFARDILLLRLAGDPALLINPDFEERLRDASSSWSRDALLGVLGELDVLLVELKRNMNKNLLATAFFANFQELRHV